MLVARVAIFDDPKLYPDDDRRSETLRQVVRQQPGFVSGYHLREEETGRLMSVTVWESDDAMLQCEQVVRQRPAEDQRGIRPDRIERWLVEGSF